MLRRALQRAPLFQGLHRTFAAANAVALPEPDWEAIEAVVSSPEGKREVASLRSQHQEALRYLEEQNQGPVEIDWASYKKDLDPALYEALHKAWTDFKPPTFDSSPLLQRVKEEFAPLLASAQEMVEHSKKRVVELDEEIKGLDEQMARLEKMTIDEAMAQNPKLAEEVDREISQGRWY